MTELITCARCGRRGVQAFTSAADQDGTTEFVCSNTTACRRRPHPATGSDAPAATGPRTATPDLAAVGALVRELDALRRRLDAQVDELTRAIGVCGEQSEEQRARLDTLTEQHTALAAVVSGLAEQVARSLRRGQWPPAVSFLAIGPEPAHIEDRLDALIEWMRQVFLRYADGATALPECWLWHPDVVEELTVLHQNWAAAFDPDTGTVALAGDWHDRYRPGVVRRLRATVGNCSLRTHAPRDVDEAPAGPEVPFTEAVGRIAAWWGANRYRPAPIPTDEDLAAADLIARPRSGAHR